MNKKLTDTEKILMDLLWEKETAFMKDLLDAFPEPKPAPTTVATLLKRMQNKNLVGYKTFGNSREYFPKIEKGKYFTGEMKGLINQFFNNSVTQFASFFTANAKLSQKELKELRDMIDKQIKD
ncbi:BlaI/MecI/CopY family transcriptional regulator [Halpernia sp. GG3]